MQLCTQAGVSYLQFSGFSELPHGSFLRTGGTSTGPFDSLNMSFSSGDISASVRANREKAQAILGINQLCFIKQEHKTHIVLADPSHVETADGLMTDKPGIGLMILHADCQAALFYDSAHHAIAAIHCGWRGNVANIYQKTVDLMKKYYQTNPADLRVAISPSLGPTAAEFINYQQEFPPSFWRFNVGNDHFDLWAISKMQLMQAGIASEHIEIASLCTYRHIQHCFSYRRLQNSGRHGTMIMLPDV